MAHCFSWSRRSGTESRRRYIPQLEILEDRTAPAGFFVTGADAGGEPLVIVRADINNDGNPETITDAFFAFDVRFRGGVRVAIGNLDLDALPELVTVSGPGAASQVLVWDVNAAGRVALKEAFFPFGGFPGGLFVTTGDINGDLRDELIVAADAGAGPHVVIFSDVNLNGFVSDNLVDSFFAYGGFGGGVRVATADIDLNGVEELITGAGPGAGPHVLIFSNAQGRFDLRVSDDPILDSFFAFDPGFRGGVFVAAGNVGGDARAEVIVSAGSLAGPHVKIFTDANFNRRVSDDALIDSFFAGDPRFTGGIRVAVSNLNGNLLQELVLATGPGVLTQITIQEDGPDFDFSPANDLARALFTPFTNFFGGVFMAFWPA